MSLSKKYQLVELFGSSELAEPFAESINQYAFPRQIIAFEQLDALFAGERNNSTPIQLSKIMLHKSKNYSNSQKQKSRVSLQKSVCVFWANYRHYLFV